MVIAACAEALWFLTAKVPRHEQEARASRMGGGVATVAVIGYAAIILPWAAAVGRRRRQAARAARREAAAARKPRQPPPRK